MQFQPTVKRRELAQRREDDRNKAAAGEVGRHLTYATCRAGSGQGGRGGGEGARRTGTEEGTARQAGSQEGWGTVRSTGSEDGAQRGCPRGQGLHIQRPSPTLSQVRDRTMKTAVFVD